MTTANSSGRDELEATQQDRTPTGRIPADTFSVRLVLARHLAGRLSIERAAAMCGLNPGNWAHWEDGRRPRDLVDVAQAIAEGLDVDFNWILLGGPLAGPRGVPTKRLRRDNDGYVTVPVRPIDTRPPGRPRMAPRVDRMIRPEQRRPVRIRYPHAA